MRLRPATLLLAELPVLAASVPDAEASDAYLKGFVTAILERELGWSRSAYKVVITGGIATLTLLDGDERKAARAQEVLAKVDGLRAVNIVLEEPASPRRGGLHRVTGAAREAGHLTEEKVFLPSGVLFAPLIADPKEPQSFVSLQNASTYRGAISPGRDRIELASVAFGGTFGLFRWLGEAEGNGFQAGVDGALFAQFDMSSDDHRLINADYTVGIPFTFREGSFSTRLRVYHQSSHLGDEFLLDYEPARVNLSFIGVQVLASKDFEYWRAYGGCEWMGNRDPSSLRAWSAMAGMEYREKARYVLRGRFVGGFALKAYQENDWHPGASLKAGMEFGPPEPSTRHFRVMLEAYKGYLPFSQFFQQRVEYLGLGAYFSF